MTQRMIAMREKYDNSKGGMNRLVITDMVQDINYLWSRLERAEKLILDGCYLGSMNVDQQLRLAQQCDEFLRGVDETKKLSGPKAPEANGR